MAKLRKIPLTAKLSADYFHIVLVLAYIGVRKKMRKKMMHRIS